MVVFSTSHLYCVNAIHIARAIVVKVRDVVVKVRDDLTVSYSYIDSFRILISFKEVGS
jgi:hypothetical protein